MACLFAKHKAEDVAGTCAANHPGRPDDEERNEGLVVQGGRGPGADGTMQAAARGGCGVAADDARPAQDVKIDIAVAAEQEAAPSESRAGIGNDKPWRLRHLLLRRLTNAGNVFQLAHLSRIFTCSWGSVVQGGRGPGADGTKHAAARGGCGVAADDARPAQDVKIDIAVAAEQEAAPSKSRAGESQGDGRAAGKPRQHGPDPAGIGNDALRRLRRLRHLLLRRPTNAGNVFQAHLSRIFTCSWLREGEAQARTGGSAGDEQRRKRLREFAKKAIPLDSVLLVTLSAHASSYRANAFFAMSMAACLLAFFADLFSAVLLINSTNFAVEWHYFLACVSSVSMMLVPYLLLVSFNKLSAYAFLAVPLPLAGRRRLDPRSVFRPASCTGYRR